MCESIPDYFISILYCCMADICSTEINWDTHGLKLLAYFPACSRTSPIFISKNQPGLQHSDPLKSSSGSNSLLVNSNSVGITSSCSVLASPLSRSTLSHCVYVSSASQYPSRTRNCARLLTVATQSSCLNCRTRSTQVRSHGNNVRDVIILGPAGCVLRVRRAGKIWNYFKFTCCVVFCVQGSSVSVL